MTKTVKKKSKRRLEFSAVMPLQFILLCKLMKVQPRQVLYDFMCNAGMEEYGLGDNQRAKAMEYFLSCGYGKHYAEEDARKIFKELDSIGFLYPNNGKEKMVNLHCEWRIKYYKHMHRKWGY